jgi:LacI family transcriptional regulator
MKKKKRVLLVVETSRGFGRQILEGIAAYIRERTNWQVFFEDRSILQKTSPWISNWSGDGIIARSVDRQTGTMLREKGIPLVELLSGHFQPDIIENHDILGSLAVNHFWERGFRHFAFFCADHTDWARRRYDAFQSHIAQKNATCALCPLPKGKIRDHHLDGLLQSPDSFLAEWLLSLPKPVGILAAIDIHAFFMLQACLVAGIAVPEEVAILGCGNDELVCSLLMPPLSSIDLNGRLFGYTAAQLLDEKMKHPRKTYPQTTIDPSHIAVRQSTDVIAINDSDVAQAIRFLRDNFMYPISIADVAEKVLLTVRTLERRFRELLGRSPESMLTNIRLDHAKMLLRETNIPVTLIGQRCGFSPSQYFMRVFRQKCGITPHQYRLKNQVILNLPPNS